MIALDTNVLVRFLVQDDPRQGRVAADLIASLSESHPGYICREVLVELVWVFERAYKMKRTQIAPVIEGILASREFVVETPERVGLALSRYAAGGAGFADRMIWLAGEEAGAGHLVTFDRELATTEGVQLLQV